MPFKITPNGNHPVMTVCDLQKSTQSMRDSCPKWIQLTRWCFSITYKRSQATEQISKHLHWTWLSWGHRNPTRCIPNCSGQFLQAGTVFQWVPEWELWLWCFTSVSSRAQSADWWEDLGSVSVNRHLNTWEKQRNWSLKGALICLLMLMT